jgi:hypothetical protein
MELSEQNPLVLLMYTNSKIGGWGEKERAGGQGGEMA